MTTRRDFLGWGSAVTAATLLPASPAWATHTARIDPSSSYGSWQGWGTSLAHWANVFGLNSTLADLFFTTDTVSFQGRSLPGLGLNVARYLLGSHTFRPVWPGGGSELPSPNEPAVYKLEGYWLNWLSDDPSNTGSWNWGADTEQRQMLLKARARGANLLQLWCDSPIWWMCKNQSPSGAADGGDNLQPWNYRQHARYIAIVAKYAKDHWGVNFNSVEPFNEPSAPWWKENNGGEGCHMSWPVQAEVIRYLRQELDARGLANVAIAASDETSYTQSNITWTNLAPLGVQELIEQVNTHGYEYNDTGSARSALYCNVHAAGTPLWQTEYGEPYEHGLELAYAITKDLRYLHPTAWSYWQPINGGPTDPSTGRDLSWGLLKGTFSQDPDRKSGTLGFTAPYPGTDAYVTNKYFVYAQYTRHIRPGMWILDSEDQATVAAYAPDKHRLVLVIVGGNSSQRITYDLSRFSTAGASARSWVTDADPNYRIARQYKRMHDAHLRGKQLTLTSDANSIQSIEIDNVWI